MMLTFVFLLKLFILLILLISIVILYIDKVLYKYNNQHYFSSQSDQIFNFLSYRLIYVLAIINWYNLIEWCLWLNYILLYTLFY